MKILLDLQGAQSQSRYRGIGRYTRDLTLAFLNRASAKHDVRLAFNAQLGDATDSLLTTFGEYAKADHRVYLRVPYDVSGQRPTNDWRRHASARLLRHAIDTLDMDVVWHSSVFEGYNEDVVMPDAPLSGAATVATLYDLIPLHEPETYLGPPRAVEWYETRAKFLSRSDQLFAISAWAGQDAVERLGLSPERVISIGAAVAPNFTPARLTEAARGALLARHGITRPFVLYNGGFDSRKNVPALISAFAALPTSVRDTHQLVIVGHVRDEERPALMAAAKQGYLPSDSVIYSGYLKDAELVQMYSECALFAYPSKMEGFGLPPLEAMACGAPVIASDTCSLPEVIGRRDALFDPYSISDITTRMTAVLGDPGFAAELRHFGQRRAAGFTWDAVACRALEGLESLCDRREQTKRTSVAYTPAGSTLACVLATDRPPTWLNQLQTHYRVRHFAPDGISPASLSAELFKANIDRILYVIDATPPAWLSEILRVHPGILLVQTKDRKPEPASEAMLCAAYLGGGYPALDQANHTDAVDPSTSILPLLNNAIGILSDDQELLDNVKRISAGMTRPPSSTLPAAGVAAACARKMERWFMTAPFACEMRLLKDLEDLSGIPSKDDLAQVAFAVAAARREPHVRQWLVDVSSIARKDTGTGVQRMVRSVLRHWLNSPPPGIRIEPVRFSDGRYRYARRYVLGLMNYADVPLDDGIVNVHAGDTFVGLDWAAESLSAATPQLEDWRRGGVECCFVVNDLLPIIMPVYFHPYSHQLSERWLRGVANLADRLICISRTTANDLSAWLAEADPSYQFGTRPRVGHFFLGADPPPPSAHCDALRPKLKASVLSGRTLLMVGTIEPRKGHSEVLDACEQLWGAGVDVSLVIVGHRGWLTETLIARLGRHTERNRRLFWFEDVSDSELNELYASCTALLAASHGEGYGLPLIEAAQIGLPVIARDLPVFREIMGEHAHYVNAHTAEDWALALRAWLDSPLPASQKISWPTWSQSAAKLAHMIQDNDGTDWTT